MNVIDASAGALPNLAVRPTFSPDNKLVRPARAQPRTLAPVDEALQGALLQAEMVRLESDALERRGSGLAG